MADRTLLERPFDPSVIRKRPGAGRASFEYVPGGDVIRRIIEATGNEFDWRVDDLRLIEGQGRAAFWLVRGTLTIAGLGTRDGVGTQPADGPESPKAAETDALKRAAVRFGVALHLYVDDAQDPAPTPRPAVERSTPAASSPPSKAPEAAAAGAGTTPPSPSTPAPPRPAAASEQPSEPAPTRPYRRTPEPPRDRPRPC